MMRFHLVAIPWLVWACWAMAQPPASATRQPAQESQQPTAMEAPLENLTRFDYQQADIGWLDGRWQLRAGPVWLKDFGRHEADAREAMRTIHELKLTEFGSIGNPRPLLEYWLSGGQAPANSLLGARTTAFERASLRVEQIQ